MSNTGPSIVKDIITFVLPRFVVECIPLLLATALFQLELARFCLFRGFLRPAGPQESLDWVASWLPWNVPAEDPRSWLGRLTLSVCSIACTASTVALDIVLIITGQGKDVHSRFFQQQQTHDEVSRDKEGESAGCHIQSSPHDDTGASNRSTEREVEATTTTTTTNRPLQRSELGLNSDNKTEKAVRFSPSLILSDVVVMDTVDGESQLQTICEHKVEERPGNPEPCWSLAPSLLADSDPDAEFFSSPCYSSSMVSAHGPSFAEVAGSRGHSVTELDQEHTFTADNIDHDKTFAQAVAKGTTGAEGDDLENGKVNNTEESADGPLVIDPKVALSPTGVAGDQDERIETRSEQDRRENVGEESSVKTFAEAAAVVPSTTTPPEESSESDPEPTTPTTPTTPVVEDSDRLQCDASSPWSPSSNKVEPPSPGASATGHESDEDHHSEQSDDTSESSERKKNKGLKKTNRRNKNKKRRERSKMDKVASRCQLDPSTTSIDTASMTPSSAVAEKDSGKRSSMEEKRTVAAVPPLPLPLTVAEQSNGGVHVSYSTAAATRKTDHDLDKGKKTQGKSEQHRQQSL